MSRDRIEDAFFWLLLGVEGVALAWLETYTVTLWLVRLARVLGYALVSFLALLALTAAPAAALLWGMP